MTCELPDIVRYLEGVTPFRQSDDATRRLMAGAAEVIYARKGDEVLSAGTTNTWLYLVRSGAVELFDGGSALNARLDEGSFFAYPSLLRGGQTRNRVLALEDSLFYRFQGQAFLRALAADEAVAHYFQGAEADRLRAALKGASAGSGNANPPSAMEEAIGNLIQREPVVAPMTMSVLDGARHMTEAGVSTLLIVDEEEDLKGIVSDKDIRGRLVAEARDPSIPLSDIMTPNPNCFAPETTVVDALIEMMRGHYRHAPIMDKMGALKGLVSGTDLMNRLATSGVQVARAVMNADSTEALQALVESQRRMVVDLRRSSLSGVRIASMVSATGMAIHRRAFELAVEVHGPPPIPMAFVCFGSLARGEQTALSDQDNGFILDDSYDEAEHGAYFLALATTVSDTLNDCGYVYCGGEIMATNELWRRPLSKWQARFSDWIRKPEAKALMHVSIFFDMAFVCGEESLADGLRSHILDITHGAGIFLARMTENALQARPPLGFFRQFVVSTHGDEARTFDIKKEGMVPLQDIARVQALANGVKATSTLARIRELSETGAIQPSDASELEDAYQFMMDIRIDHQSEQIADGESPTNFIAPQALNRFEREHLRAAFKLIQVHQDVLSRSFAGGYF